MKFVFVIYLLLLFLTLNNSSAQQKCDNVRSSGSYSKDDTQKRVDLLIINNFGKKYYLMQSSLFVFSWTNDDIFNDHKNNIALGTLVDLFTKYELLFNSDSKLLSTILSIPNSKHHFFYSEIFSNSDFCKNGSPTLGFIGSSIFFKSNTDLYIFRTNKWMNYSPGFGVSFYFVWPYVEIGITRNIVTDFSNTVYDNTYFFTIGLIGKND